MITVGVRPRQVHVNGLCVSLSDVNPVTYL